MRNSKATLPGALTALLIPSALLLIFYRFFTDAADIRLQLAILHVAALLWVCFFVYKRPCRISVLPASFVLSLLGPYLIEAGDSGALRHMGTAVLLIVYALPWTAVTLVAAVVILIKDKKGRKSIDFEL